MFLNRLWADWQKYLYCYLSGTVMVTIENQLYSAETHCDQSPGACSSSVLFQIRETFLIQFVSSKQLSQAVC